jgi:hypothetical protein
VSGLCLTVVQERRAIVAGQTQNRWLKRPINGNVRAICSGNGAPRPMNEGTAELAAYTDLFLRTRRGSAPMNFAGISDQSPTVRLFAHSKAGQLTKRSYRMTRAANTWLPVSMQQMHPELRLFVFGRETFEFDLFR